MIGVGEPGHRATSSDDNIPSNRVLHVGARTIVMLSSLPPPMRTSFFPLTSVSSSRVPAAHTAAILHGTLSSAIAFITVCCAPGFIASPRSQAAPVTAAPTVTAPTPKPMKTYAVFRRRGWASSGELAKAGARSSDVGQKQMSDRVRWIRSYVTDEGRGRVGTISIYEAMNEDAVREHARRAGLPCDVVVPVIDTVVINPDPVQRAKP